jgi:hypothetical protein
MADDVQAKEAEAPEARKGKKSESFLERIEHHWIEIAAAALMALATIMSAFCAYQSSWWHSKEAMHYNSSDQALIKTSDLKDKMNQETAVDIDMLSNYLNALAQGDTHLASIYQNEAFSDALKKVFPMWEQAKASGKPDVPKTPFQMPEYKPRHFQETVATQTYAHSESQKAKQASDHANGYLLLTVLFASVLFFAGIGTKFSTKGLKLSVLSMGALIFIASVVVLAVQP